MILKRLWTSESYFPDPLLNLFSIRRRSLDLLVPGSFPNQFYSVGREVIKKKIFFFFLTHGNLNKQTVRRDVKNKVIFLTSVKIHT